jgi:AcrR family transcriptional regulator
MARKLRTARLVSRLPDPTEVGDGELNKSGRTRRDIMEAAVECLAQFGYSGTTTTTVASRAGLTRAAMLYHFPSRMALVEATIHYVTRRRIEMYMEAVSAMPHGPRFVARMIDESWRQLRSKEFLAFCELSTAARTDTDLAAMFGPALAAYDKARRNSARELFPESVSKLAGFDLRRDITRFLLEGLAQQDGLSYDAPRRKSAMIAFVKALAEDEDGQALLARIVRGL